MTTQKTNDTTAVVTIDIDDIFDRFEKQARTNRRLTFVIFACASYIAVKHFSRKDSIKQKLDEWNNKKGE